MSDKPRIVYGHLCCTDFSYGFVSFDGTTWKLDEEAAKEHFCHIANAGANAVRILPYAVWGDRPHGRKSQFCPWVLRADGLWDLDRFNDYYFPIMKRLVQIINSYGMTVWFALFDHCQQQPGYWSGMCPWKHNSNGVSSFYDTAADRFCTKWIQRCFLEFQGCKVFWPWGNELANQVPAAEWAKRVIFPLVKEPFENMTYGFVMDDRPYLGQGQFADKPDTTQDTVRKWFGMEFPPERNKTLITREVHNCGGPEYDTYCPLGLNPAQSTCWWGNNPAVGPFGWSDDGVEEWDNVADAGRPDADRLHYMTTTGLDLRNQISFIEHCPENPEWEYQEDVIKAISLAYKEHFGYYPTNYGKWQYVPPTPPIPPDPPVPPEPPTCYEKYIKDRPFWKWQVWRFLACIFGGK